MADALPMKPEYEYQTVEETADPEKDIHSTAHHNGEDRTKLKHPPMAEALPMQPEYENQEIPETAHEEKCIQCSADRNGEDYSKPKRPPRSERKRQRHAEMIQRQKEMRKRKKLERKERIREQGQDAGSETSLSREEMRKRCEEGMKTGQIICIDCSLEQHMSDKEKGKLAMQVGRLYGSNRRVDNPAHIYLTGVNKGGQLYSELVKKNSGFENYLIEVEEKSHIELFPLERVVYLSPDSNNLLEDVDPGKIYVIGGLVDESVKKHITLSQAEGAAVTTARLPIVENMVRTEVDSPSQVLAVNQVFDILINYSHTKDWKNALAVGVPRRKGFIVENGS